MTANWGRRVGDAKRLSPRCASPLQSSPSRGALGPGFALGLQCTTEPNLPPTGTSSHLQRPTSELKARHFTPAHVSAAVIASPAHDERGASADCQGQATPQAITADRLSLQPPRSGMPRVSRDCATRCHEATYIGARRHGSAKTFAACSPASRRATGDAEICVEAGIGFSMSHPR